jgi:hypothetical protein
VAQLAPRPDVLSSVRKLPASKAKAKPAAVVPAPAAAPPASSAVVLPLSPDRYKVQVTIGGDTLEKLRLAKDLLRHAIPSGDEAAILDRALTALLAELAKKKFAAADQPRPSPASGTPSRHVPAPVRRAVWRRDRGRCAFWGSGGRRCNVRAFVEFHHVQPYALGGPPTVANIELRCRRHNGHEARVQFDSFQNEKSGAARESRCGSRSQSVPRCSASATSPSAVSRSAPPSGVA